MTGFPVRGLRARSSRQISTRHKSTLYKCVVQASIFQRVLLDYARLEMFRSLTRWIVRMRAMIIVLGVCLLAACAPVTENTPGEVFLLGDEEVVIVGPKADGKPAYPTNRMIEQAKGVCSTAYFINARPSMSKPSSFDYLFRC